MLTVLVLVTISSLILIQYVQYFCHSQIRAHSSFSHAIVGYVVQYQYGYISLHVGSTCWFLPFAHVAAASFQYSNNLPPMHALTGVLSSSTLSLPAFHSTVHRCHSLLRCCSRHLLNVHNSNKTIPVSPSVLLQQTDGQTDGIHSDVLLQQLGTEPNFFFHLLL